MMGFCRRGGYRPSRWQWDWSRGPATGVVWLGDFNAGLQCKLKGPKENWRLFGEIPPSWGNEGKSSAAASEEPDAVGCNLRIALSCAI
jgi:hypothetical protein